MRKLAILLLALLLLTSCGAPEMTEPALSPTPKTTMITPTPESPPAPTPNREHLEEIVAEVQTLYSEILTVDSIEGQPSTASLSIILETSSLQDLYGRCITNDEDAWEEWDTTREDLLNTSRKLKEIMADYGDRRIISVQILSTGGASYWTFTPEKVLYDGVDPIKEKAAAAAEKEAAEIRRGEDQLYILNTSSKVFHYPNCSSVDKIKDKNKSSAYGTREEMISRGYKACGNCHP